jgi:hypothetical protein
MKVCERCSRRVLNGCRHTERRHGRKGGDVIIGLKGFLVVGAFALFEESDEVVECGGSQHARDFELVLEDQVLGFVDHELSYLYTHTHYV